MIEPAYSVYRERNNRRLTGLVWRLGRPWFRLGRRSQPGPLPNADIRSILIPRSGGIGDMIFITGLVLKARQLFPNAKVTVVTRPEMAPILQGLPGVNIVESTCRFQVDRSPATTFRSVVSLRRVIDKDYDLLVFTPSLPTQVWFTMFLPGKYKVGYDFNDRGYDLPLTHTHRIYTDLSDVRCRPMADEFRKDDFQDLLGTFIGRQIVPARPRIVLTREETQFAAAWLQQHRIRERFAVILPGSSDLDKNWPVGRFVTLREEMAKRLGCDVIVMGGPAERVLEPFFKADTDRRFCFSAGDLSLRQTFSVLARTIIAIGNDTGPLHAAAAFKRPTVSIHRCQSSPSYAYETPINKWIKIAETRSLCDGRNPCRLQPHGTVGPPPCLGDISVAMVLDKIAEVLLGGPEAESAAS